MVHKAQFFTDLSITHVGGRWWRYNRPLCYYSKLANATLCGPTGFVFNGVSRVFANRPTPPSGNHDLLYRWNFVGYIMADRIFNESMKVNKQLVLNRWMKTAVLFCLGWIAKKSLNGCLDHRNCKSKTNCVLCDKYYPNWQRCYVPGFHPELWKEHV